MNIYLNEYNVRMGDMSYLPLVSGLLRASVTADCNFMPFIYAIDPLKKILDRYTEPPDVAAFSAVMWNEQLCLAVAREVKGTWPDCKIVFGGPQVPHHPAAYMKEHPFIDICVRAEGEEPFAAIIDRLQTTDDLSGIADVTWAGGENAEQRSFERDLDHHPSPYLEGLFDDLVEEGRFQAIIETNRGCPFKCTFCYWGRGGLSRKYKYYGIDRVKRELEWCAEKRIPYIFNADSNFGMHARDGDLAQFLVDLKERTGYPEKFRTCFGKNTDDKIFAIGSLFHKNDMEKGITLARQSNDPTVLKNIKRGNISMDTYRNLQDRFNAENIPIYTELILGLPGETVETWKAGIEEILMAGLKNQLYIYFCQVYPNTDLGDPAYREQFGIETIRLPLTEIHGSIRSTDLVTEYEDVVIKTASMSTEEWREMAVLSWMTMLLHSLKLGYFILERATSPIAMIERVLKGSGVIADLVEWFYARADAMLAGEGRGQIVAGNIYWDIEEAAFIRTMLRADDFYAALRAVFPEVSDDVFEYQQSRIPTVDLYDGDIERWAQETIMYGRKSGTMLLPE